jgi:hypothetical protein
MMIAHTYTLLLEAAALATSSSMLWLSFWPRDRYRRHHHRAADFASDQQDGANVSPLALARVSGTRLTIDLVSSDVQPAGEKDEAVLYRPEHAQHLNDKPQIQAEQHQGAQLKPMKSDPVIHESTAQCCGVHSLLRLGDKLTS